jgi:hypothetical protein
MINNIIQIIGCDHIRTTGQIDETFGMFAPLDEAFKRISPGHIIPALNNTKCACRRTKYCSVECSSAVSGVMVNGHISYSKKGRLM